jgi:hypothetical protein
MKIPIQIGIETRKTSQKRMLNGKAKHDKTQAR